MEDHVMAETIQGQIMEDYYAQHPEELGKANRQVGVAKGLLKEPLGGWGEKLMTVPTRAYNAVRGIEKDIAAIPQFAGAAVLNTITGGGAESLVDRTGKNLEDRAARYGITLGGTLGGPQAKKVVPGTPAVGIKKPEVVTGGEPAKAEKNIYDILRSMNDKQFEQFVSEGHTVPGVGMIKDKNGIKRLIEDPSMKKPNLNYREAELLHKFVEAEHKGKAVDPYRADREERQKEAAEGKKQSDFLKAHGVLYNGPDGRQVDMDSTLWNARERGVTPPKGLAEAASIQDKEFQRFWQTQFTDGKGNVDPKLVAAYDKNKEVVTRKIKKMFGDSLRKGQI
jgi:hypothetical protein